MPIDEWVVGIDRLAAAQGFTHEVFIAIGGNGDFEQVGVLAHTAMHRR